MILFIEVSLMIVSGSLLFLFAPNMMRLFSRDAQVIALGVTVLRMVAVSEPFYGVSIIVEGMMQGMGNTMMPFVCSIAGMWGVRIVGTFICTQLLGMGAGRVRLTFAAIAHNRRSAVCPQTDFSLRCFLWGLRFSPSGDYISGK